MNKTALKILIAFFSLLIVIIFLNIPFLYYSLGKNNLEKNQAVKAYKQLKKA